jgi:hypothetical protein
MAKLCEMIQGTGTTVVASKKFTYLLDANYKQDIDDNRHKIEECKIGEPMIWK